MKMWNALIVDDEALARSNLQLALAEHPQWRCVGACASAAEARVALAQREVDLLLLDIQMPRQNGLAFAAELAQQPSSQTPLVVFVTAYDEHALSAFDVFALDYLLKPFDDQRFAAMLGRAEQWLSLQQGAALQAEAVQAFVREQQSRAAGEGMPELPFLSVRSVGRVERIAVADIEWISAAGNYVELHLAPTASAAARVVLHRSTLAALEERLPRGQFQRVHRTALVRPETFASLAVTGDSTYALSLRSGEVVPVSERFVKEVRARFG